MWTYSDTNHCAHHSNSAHLQPGLPTESIKDKDWNPGKDEKYYPDTARCKITRICAFYAAALEKGGL